VSTPDGTNQIPISVQWIEPNVRFRFSAKSLPGSSQGRLRAVVTDGALSSEAYSMPRTFRNQKPLVSILDALPERIFGANAPISIRGVAYDPEDGILSGPSLQWRLNDGPSSIGSDEWVTLPSLPPGDHTLTLEAIDNAGEKQEAQTRIKVVLPGHLYFAQDPQSGEIVLQWAGNGILQSSSKISGPWTEVNTGSPYAIPDNLLTTFYRVRW